MLCPGATKPAPVTVENHAWVFLDLEEVSAAKVLVTSLVLRINRVGVDDEATVDSPITVDGTATIAHA